MARKGWRTVIAAGTVAAASVAGMACIAFHEYFGVVREIQRLHDPDLRTQELAATALSRYGTWVLPRLVRELRESPEDRGEDVFPAAMTAMAFRPPPGAVRVTRGTMTSAPAAPAPGSELVIGFEPDRRFDRAVAQTALKIGHDAIPVLIRCLDDDNERVVSTCAAALACSLLPLDAPSVNGEAQVALTRASGTLTVTFLGYRVTEVKVSTTNAVETPLVALLETLADGEERPAATRAAAAAMLKCLKGKKAKPSSPPPQRPSRAGAPVNAGPPSGPSATSPTTS